MAVSAEEEPERFQEQWLNENPDFLHRLHVVARSTPLQKLRIVSALKKTGELVAVTGDGVNDVPALKAVELTPFHLTDWATIIGWITLFLSIQMFVTFVISRYSSRRN